jgi:hypothetical protein
MKYRCDNLQAAVINMEEMKQLDRNKYADALTYKDSIIIDLNKKITYLEKQLQVRNKTDLLITMRSNTDNQ